MDAPIFVVGMPRSGTTLMAAILRRHPERSIAVETHYLTRWMARASDLELRDVARFDAFWRDFTAHRDFRAVRGLDPDVARQRVLAERPLDHRSIFASLLRQYAEGQGKARWGEKTPDHFRFVEQLLGWYPEARIVFMLRDPRAVVASRLLIDADWGHKPVDRLAARWRDSVQRAERHAGDPRVRIVRYEDLVLDAEAELREVCAFVGVGYAPTMLGQPTEVEQPSDSRPTYKPSGPIATGGLRRWQDRLSSTQVALVEHVARSEMVRHGYELVTSGLPPRRRLLLGAKRISRRARRVAAGVVRGIAGLAAAAP